MTRLVTDRLVLRAARDDELAALHRIYGDPRAMRYWDTPPHASLDDTRRMHAWLAAPGPRRYFVWEHGGEIVGCGGIHTKRELGFILHPDHWGKGLAREGAQAVIDHIWDTTDWPNITSEADPRNLNSVKLLTRLGFCVTGFVRDAFCVAGEWSDSVYFALPRPPAAG